MNRKKILLALIGTAAIIAIAILFIRSEESEDTVSLQTQPALQTPKMETKSQRFKVKGGFELKK